MIDHQETKHTVSSEPIDNAQCGPATLGVRHKVELVDLKRVKQADRVVDLFLNAKVVDGITPRAMSSPADSDDPILVAQIGQKLVV